MTDSAPRFPWLYGSVLPIESANRMKQLQDRAHDIYLMEIGNGEPDEKNNNWGPDVIRYRRGDMTNRTWKSRGAWCATLRSYSFAVAANSLRYVLPFETSRGARAVTKNIANAGRWIVKPGDDIPTIELLSKICPRGATLAFNRGSGPDDWRKHVVSLDHFELGLTKPIVFIEGNRNNRGKAGARYSVVDYRAVNCAYLRSNLWGIASAY